MIMVSSSDLSKIGQVGRPISVNSKKSSVSERYDEEAVTTTH